MAVLAVHHDNKLVTMPTLDATLPLNVTTQYGAHAHLVCRVQDVANKSVRFLFYYIALSSLDILSSCTTFSLTTMEPKD